MEKNIQISPLSQTTQTPLFSPAFHRKTLSEVAKEVGKLPQEAYVLAMATDGLPLLVNLDDIRCGVLFLGHYNILSIPKINQVLKKDEYKVNYTAFSSTDCLSMSDEVIAYMGCLGGKQSKNIVFFEDFSLLAHAVRKNMEKTQALQRCLSFKNTFLIGNCLARTEVVYGGFGGVGGVGGVGGGWKKYFDVLVPTTSNDVFVLYENHKPVYVYAPM